MGTSNISGIGKIFVQGQVSGVNGTAQEDDLAVAFTEVMSQMSAMAESVSVDTESMTSVSAVDTEFRRSGNREVKIQEKTKPELKQENVSEKAEEFTENVKEVLKDELGVSDEQIEEAMETLGLTFADLLNSNQLAALVAELTGTEDMSALLCSEEFMTVMKEIGALGKNLMQELGVTSEELTQLLEMSQNSVDAEAEVPEAATGIEVSGDAVQMEQEVPEDGVQMGQEMPQDNVQAVESTTDAMANATGTQQSTEDEVAVVNAAENSETAETKLSVNEKVQSDEALEEAEVHLTTEAEKAVQVMEGDTETGFSEEQSANESGVQTKNDALDSVNQNAAETTFAQVQNNARETVPQVQSAAVQTTQQVDVAEVVRQIVEYSKVVVTNHATTMEMQLNPENLGKIYMEITSKDGVVSAHITAQNEVVKEALESQLVELRQNLNQAGVKVDAVEVAVGSHEFERNLEQNAKQHEEQAAEREKTAKQTRRINLSDLDELSGLMTEEESLVVQMMAANGNSIDYTA